jgi:hypothetical protein
MYEPQHHGSHLRVPKRSIPEISDHLATGQHFPPDQNLVEQYNHVKGDGFSHPMRKPSMPDSPKKMPRGRMPR